MLTGYCKKIANNHNSSIGKIKKFVPNFGNKINYALLYKNLQSYLQLGVRLRKIYGVLKFEQS